MSLKKIKRKKSSWPHAFEQYCMLKSRHLSCLVVQIDYSTPLVVKFVLPSHRNRSLSALLLGKLHFSGTCLFRAFNKDRNKCFIRCVMLPCRQRLTSFHLVSDVKWLSSRWVRYWSNCSVREFCSYELIQTVVDSWLNRQCCSSMSSPSGSCRHKIKTIAQTVNIANAHTNTQIHK